MFDVLLLLGSIPYVAVLAWVTCKIYFHAKLEYNRTLLKEMTED